MAPPTSEPITVAAVELRADWPRAGLHRVGQHPSPWDMSGGPRGSAALQRVAPGHNGAHIYRAEFPLTAPSSTLYVLSHPILVARPLLCLLYSYSSPGSERPGNFPKAAHFVGGGAGTQEVASTRGPGQLAPGSSFTILSFASRRTPCTPSSWAECPHLSVSHGI